MRYFGNIAIIFLSLSYAGQTHADHFLTCTVAPIAISAIKYLQAFKGMDDPNCQPSDDCVELDHYPEMLQGHHGTCWRMALTNVLRHAISNHKGVCIDKVSPFSFGGGQNSCPECEYNYSGLSFGIGSDNEAGDEEGGIRSINSQKGRLHISPSYVFDCKNEQELMHKLDDLAQEKCGRSRPWQIKTEGGKIEFNARMVSSICGVFHRHGPDYIRKLIFAELMSNMRKIDPGVDNALEESLSPSPILGKSHVEFLPSTLFHLEYDSKDDPENKEGISGHAFRESESYSDRYKMIRRALETTHLPVILNIGGGTGSVLHSLHLSWILGSSEDNRGHAVTVTAARTRADGKQQIFLEDSNGIYTGWQDLRIFDKIKSYMWVRL